jgi:hypothetical protein
VAPQIRVAGVRDREYELPFPFDQTNLSENESLNRRPALLRGVLGTRREPRRVSFHL